MKRLFIIIFLILISFSQAFGVEFSSGKVIGMGLSYTTVARGSEACFWNPANLGLPGNSSISLTIFSVGINLANNSFSLKNYNDYTGKFLTENDKTDILSAIPQMGLNLRADGSANLLAISYKNVALFFSGTGTSALNLPKDPLEVLFYGNKLNDTLNVEKTSGEAWGKLSLGFSWGKRVINLLGKDIYTGLTFRYIKGLIYENIVTAQGYTVTEATQIKGEQKFQIKSSTGGEGFSSDLGFAIKLSPKLMLGLSLTNLFSQIRWTKGNELKTYTITLDSLNAENIDGDSVVITEDYTEKISPFKSQEPILLRIGTGYSLKKILFSFDWEQGFKEGASSSTKPRVSFGTDYKLLSFLSLRGGISLSKITGLYLSTGLGLNLGAFNLDMGVANQRGLFNNSKGITLGISSGLRI
jgi:hypothetical protein